MLSVIQSIAEFVTELRFNAGVIASFTADEEKLSIACSAFSSIQMGAQSPNCSFATLW